MLHAAGHFLCGLQGQHNQQKVALESVAPGFWCGLEDAAICAVAYENSVFIIKIVCGPLKHHAEENSEEGWCKDAPLFYPV